MVFKKPTSRQAHGIFEDVPSQVQMDITKMALEIFEESVGNTSITPVHLVYKAQQHYFSPVKVDICTALILVEKNARSLKLHN